MKTVALLTGRGQNTMRDKNVQDVCGHPVLYYPAKAARLAKNVDGWYVSSDDDKILNAAHDIGYGKIVRPKELALPTSQHVDAIRHALTVLGEQGIHPEILVVMLANNVTIMPQWIEDCVDMLIKDPSLTSVVPVYREMDHHPMRAKKMDTNGILSTFMDLQGKKVSTNRQDLEPCYFLSHNFWALRVKLSVELCDGEGPWSFMGKNTRGYVVDESIDIHEEFDLKKAEHWVEKHWAE